MKLERISKHLSYLLRHCCQPLYIDPDGGWADVETILGALRQYAPETDRAMLDRIVASDRKGRYSYDPTGTRIRANQGHSIPNVTVEMTQPEPPEFLYHGTATRFLPGILAEGLKPMSRRFVHLSAQYDTAVAVGKRHGVPVVLVIRAADFASDGHGLLLSANGVWQAEEVPPEYISLAKPE